MILINFCGFKVYSKPNNRTLSAFPEKIPEIRKIVFNFQSVASPNVVPKPTDQSRSHSISRVPLQISLARFFVFDLPPKLRVVLIRKKLKFSFSQKWLQRFLPNFMGLLYIRTPTIWDFRPFTEKSLLLEYYFLISYLSPNIATKPTYQSCSISIFRVLLQISPASPFHFRPTLMLSVVHIRNKKRSDKQGI